MELALERRLAAIVIVDLAGYTAQTEVDEVKALRMVEALRASVDRAVAEHGGRVFNTAGDGFMLEFLAISEALKAAADIVHVTHAPVRAAVHLGEVTVSPRGDLLGHGVNIAARLQALAPIGGVLASDTVRRALTGDLAHRLRSQGRVKLDKMSTALEVFSLDMQDGRGPGRPKRGVERFWPLAAALAALLVVSLGALIYSNIAGDELRVAVAAFDAASSDPQSRAAARAMAGDISAALSDRQVATIPEDRARRGAGPAARILVGGEVERVGDVLSVRVRLDDRRTGRLLWSSTFQQPADRTAELRIQAAAKVADISSLTAKATGSSAGKIDPDTLAAFLKLFDQRREGRQRAVENLALDRRIVAGAPKSSLAHASLAYDLAASRYGRSPAVSAAMAEEARLEAQRAIALDRKSGEPYLALAELEAPTALAARQAIISRGLAVEPEHATLNTNMGDHLRSTGRMREAEAFYRRGLALDPFSPSKAAGTVFALGGTGRPGEALAIAERALLYNQEYTALRRAVVYTTAVYGEPEAALAAIAAAETQPVSDSPAEARLLRDYVEMRRRGQTDPAVLRRIGAAADLDLFEPSLAMSILARAGDIDGAFHIANAALDRGAFFYPATLFEQAAAPMRRDPRFMTLSARLGLTQYWRTTGRWPDFCADRGLGYDCKAKAA